jgi:hypothetical protein
MLNNRRILLEKSRPWAFAALALGLSLAATAVAPAPAAGSTATGTASGATPDMFNFNLGDLATIQADDAATPPASNSRYFFGLLDHRSNYAKGFFPGSFLAADLPAEREVAMTWYHFEKPGMQNDIFYNEVKWGLDQWTAVFEAPYQHDHVEGSVPGSSRNLDGFANFNIAFRSPVYQYVSPNGFWDYSVVPQIVVNAPSGSAVDTGTSITAEAGELLGIGKHIGLQWTIGNTFLTGSHLGGNNSLDWSAIASYNLYHRNVPIPGLADITPMMEIFGTQALSGPGDSQQSIGMDFGVEINPKPAWGYLTPYVGFAGGPMLTRAARSGGDWVISAYIAFALP